MNNKRWLPIGSVVNVRESAIKFMIISRGLLIAQNEGEGAYYDYGGCAYPQGLINEQIMYFNSEDITEVLFRGFENEYERRLQNNLSEWVEKLNVKNMKETFE